MKISVLAAGPKGHVFVRGLLRKGIVPDRVVSYDQRGDPSDAFGAIRRLAEEAEIAFADSRRPVLLTDHQHLLVGWQYLVDPGGDNVIVFHDGLLPSYRGFAPTVTALIAGEPRIGITALRPDEGIDTGPILGRRVLDVEYPIRMQQVLDWQEGALVDLAGDVLDGLRAGTLEARPQDEAEATYSLWRDETDYRIDWTWTADRIHRFVDAVSTPYPGAETTYRGEIIKVDRVSPVGDLRFVERFPGKLWSVEGRNAVVVCGRGMLRIDEARTASGDPVVFDRLRARLG